MSDVIGTLEQVAFERQMVRGAALYVDLASEAMLATPEGLVYAARKQELVESKELLTRAETEARDAILAAYRETGNKKPAEGAGVRVTRKARYDLAIATAWAQTSAPALLVLDAKAFEKANLPGAPIEWEETPTATIATDLTMYEEAEA
jgi:hypothetical protein